MLPVNVPPARYSRDEVAVVRAGIGNCVSSLAASFNTQPSGVVTTDCSAEPTVPVSGGAPGSPSTGGRASAFGSCGKTGSGAAVAWGAGTASAPTANNAARILVMSVVDTSRDVND